jgi:hypothetical protein
VAQPARRISSRTRLGRPIEARLVLCRDEAAEGWVVDEQEEGVGMRFGGADAERLLAHRECCGNRVLEFTLSGPTDPRFPLPVRIVHLSAAEPGKRECRAGLLFERAKMKPEQVERLLSLWALLRSAARA